MGQISCNEVYVKNFAYEFFWSVYFDCFTRIELATFVVAARDARSF